MFDYRPTIGPPDPEESQQEDRETDGHVGANHNDNCGPAIYAVVFKQLGNGDPHEPQEIAGKLYRGGMTTAHIWAFFTAHRSDYPNWADITVQQGGDVVALANGAAKQRFPMVAWFWSDAAAVVKPYRTGILHWCEIVADDGQNLILRNPEWMTDVPLPYAQARAAYAGEFTTFHRSLSMATIDDVYNELRGDGAHSKLDMIYTELRGDAPNSKLDLLLSRLQEASTGTHDPELKASIDALNANLQKIFKL